MSTFVILFPLIVELAHQYPTSDSSKISVLNTFPWAFILPGLLVMVSGVEFPFLHIFSPSTTANNSPPP